MSYMREPLAVREAEPPALPAKVGGFDIGWHVLYCGAAELENSMKPVELRVVAPAVETDASGRL